MVNPVFCWPPRPGEGLCTGCNAERCTARMSTVSTRPPRRRRPMSRLELCGFALVASLAVPYVLVIGAATGAYEALREWVAECVGIYRGRKELGLWR